MMLVADTRPSLSEPAKRSMSFHQHVIFFKLYTQYELSVNFKVLNLSHCAWKKTPASSREKCCTRGENKSSVC